MSDEVLRKVDVDWLLSIYGALLTDKQRAMAALYYDEDLSRNCPAGKRQPSMCA